MMWRRSLAELAITAAVVTVLLELFAVRMVGEPKPTSVTETDDIHLAPSWQPVRGTHFADAFFARTPFSVCGLWDSQQA
jgi:hypothetical protein